MSFPKGPLDDMARIQKIINSTFGPTKGLGPYPFGTEHIDRLRAQMNVITKPFADVFSAIEKMSPTIQNFQETISRLTFAPLVDSVMRIQESVSLAIRNAILPISLPKLLLPNLPDLSRVMGTLQELAREIERQRKERSEDALRESGYAYLSASVTFKALAEFERLDPQSISAAATNNLLGQLRKPDFHDRLQSNILASTMLKRRWKIIEAALLAHSRKEYFLSIPPLLAQIEGSIADALIVMGQVTPADGKLWQTDGDGNFILNSKNKRISINGLGPLVQHSKWNDHEVLHGIASLTADQLANQRNQILHGRHVSYGKAKLSVISLIVLDILAAEFASFEHPAVQSNQEV